MFTKQLIRFLQYEYRKGKPDNFHINNALKYYYETNDKDEIKRNKITLSQFNMNAYNKIILHDDLDFSLNLILWGKNSYTKIHKHNSKCNFVVLEGTLFETKYENADVLKLSKSSELETGSVSGVESGEYHNIFNIDPSKTLSLHVYDNHDYHENINLLMG
jgi:predicted metal-dependent enzyme (double-stranded beta helix superfamily)